MTSVGMAVPSKDQRPINGHCGQGQSAKAKECASFIKTDTALWPKLR
jgi:hypothetical protein